MRQFTAGGPGRGDLDMQDGGTNELTDENDRKDRQIHRRRARRDAPKCSVFSDFFLSVVAIGRSLRVTLKLESVI